MSYALLVSKMMKKRSKKRISRTRKMRARHRVRKRLLSLMMYVTRCRRSKIVKLLKTSRAKNQPPLGSIRRSKCNSRSSQCKKLVITNFLNLTDDPQPCRCVVTCWLLSRISSSIESKALISSWFSKKERVTSWI